MGLLPLGTAVDLKFSIVSFSILTTEGSLKARLLNSHGSAVMLKRQYDCEMVHGVWSFGGGGQVTSASRRSASTAPSPGGMPAPTLPSATPAGLFLTAVESKSKYMMYHLL